jgi:hypothetical protein
MDLDDAPTMGAAPRPNLNQQPAQNPPGIHIQPPNAMDHAEVAIDYSDLMSLLQAARRLKREERHYRSDPGWPPIRDALEDWRAVLGGKTDTAAYFVHEIDKVL